MRENGASNGWQGASLSRSSSAAGLAEQLGDTDVLYLKNVVLKFLDACTAGKTEQVQSPPCLQESRCCGTLQPPHAWDSLLICILRNGPEFRETPISHISHLLFVETAGVENNMVERCACSWTPALPAR